MLVSTAQKETFTKLNKTTTDVMNRSLLLAATETTVKHKQGNIDTEIKSLSNKRETMIQRAEWEQQQRKAVSNSGLGTLVSPESL